MQKILIPIGFHPVSEKIAEVGYELAKKLNSKACLLHVIEDIPYYNMEYTDFLGFEGITSPVNIQIAEETQNVAEDFLKKAAAHLHNDVETHIERGDTADRILEYAREWGADIIVLGTHSHSVLEKIFMGSQAVKVLEETKIPVYMVPVKK